MSGYGIGPMMRLYIGKLSPVFISNPAYVRGFFAFARRSPGSRRRPWAAGLALAAGSVCACNVLKSGFY